MAFTLALVALIGLSLTNLQPASASYFGGNGGGDPAPTAAPTPPPNPNPGQGGELSDEIIREFLDSSPSTRQAIENARLNNLNRAAVPVPCDCPNQLLCANVESPFGSHDLTIATPANSLFCGVIFPQNLMTTGCTPASNGALCTDGLACYGSTLTCKEGGAMIMDIVALCFVPGAPFSIVPAFGMQSVNTNCCCAP